MLSGANAHFLVKVYEFYRRIKYEYLRRLTKLSQTKYRILFYTLTSTNSTVILSLCTRYTTRIKVPLTTKYEQTLSTNFSYICAQLARRQWVVIFDGCHFAHTGGSMYPRKSFFFLLLVPLLRRKENISFKPYVTFHRYHRGRPRHIYKVRTAVNKLPS